ncbi:MAG: molybdopterin cofactor-binding domain-containing protein [Candidatus Pelethousia sp.]|nr:molybdopterin cofactor-binding domain-containing protein [Candidatus Pelethousia sp.]
MIPTSEFKVVGKREVRKDSLPKATGAARYAADIKMPGMLCGKALRSEYPHAKILSIDTDAAKAMPGVHAVLTAKDIPGINKFGLAIADQEVLASKKVRMMGDAVALVAAETLEQCEAALRQIKVAYQELPGVFSIEDGIKEGAPLVHEDVPGNLLQHTMVRKGDVSTAWADCAYIVENDYTTQRVEHAYIEPEVAVAYIDTMGVMNVLNSTQYTFRDRRQIAPVIDMPHNMVRVQQQTTGGGFGGKDDITCEIQAALLALKTGRPVKVVWTRSESMACSTKRHPMKIHVKTGCDKNGKLLAMEGTVYSDKGAYCSIGHFITKKAGLHLAGPYYIPNICVDTYSIYTNNTISGPYRGFGILQSAFAHESQMDQLADLVGMDPLEFRLLNCLKHGLSTATGQVFTQGVGFEDTLLAMKEYMGETDLYGEEGDQ